MKLFISIIICLVYISCNQLNEDNNLTPDKKKIQIQLTEEYLHFTQTQKSSRENWSGFHDKVNQIELEMGEAAILLKSEKKKTSPILLGGYFYSGFDLQNRFSKDQLTWIGNNCKVFSTNEYYKVADRNLNGGAEPKDVNYLKEINPELRYYLMFFATSLHRPYFVDSTMRDWTLKDLEGKPALSVRRKSHTDDIFTMDMRNKDWQEWFRNFTIEECQRYGADGFITDEIMWSGYWGTNLDKLRDYSTHDEIRFAAYDWKDKVGKDHPFQFLHQAFWDAAQKNSDGVWGEQKFYGEDGIKARNIFYEKRNLLEVIENAYYISDQDKTYIWAGWVDDDVNQVLYMIGAYLMAKNGNYMVLQPHLRNDQVYGGTNTIGYDLENLQKFTEKYKSYLNVPLGNPIEKYQIVYVDGQLILQREFENGIVYLYMNQ